MNDFKKLLKKENLYHFHIGALEKIVKRLIEPILTTRSGAKKIIKLAIFTICILFDVSNGHWDNSTLKLDSNVSFIYLTST
jgi:ferredoxin-fold anticodon binding domain-containing protein